MNKFFTLFSATLALGIGCHQGAGARAGAHAGAAAENVGSGTVNAAESAGHGVAYGAREVGQTLSGTQGNPQAEAISQQDRARMEREAHQAGQHFDQAGQQITGHGSVDTNDSGSARGGGPAPK